jgi:hypothetical protein
MRVGLVASRGTALKPPRDAGGAGESDRRVGRRRAGSAAHGGPRQRELGFRRATNLIGGFSAWRAEGLPLRPAREREAADELPGMGGPEPLEADQEVAIADDIDLRKH